MRNLNWIKEGLKFKCTGCGKCCTGAPGYVFLSEEEIVEMANFLNLSLEDFVKSYIRQVEDRFSLREKPGPLFDCVFLDGKKCSVYPIRPKQCRTFPFWPQNLESEQTWQNTAASCEGINEDAPVIPRDQIISILK